ncbi:MAG: tetratricopeptide repeat protein [Planctomycetota bacterium]|nr:tetratricopeptide repeat protein [Planctomycetota bacterium]
MHSTDFSNLSAEPSAIRGLTPEQKEHLTEILDRYLSALENGVPPPPEEILAQHPDLAGPLRLYLDRLDALHDVAAGFVGPASLVPAGTAPHQDEGKRLGDYVLLREIGHGGMGVVYEARQVSLDRRVALKVLPFAAVLDSKQTARFKIEAQAAAQLHHPNIVSVFAIGVERGVHYYAMQYIDGQPLDLAIRQLREQLRPARQRKTSTAAPTTGDSTPLPSESTQKSLLTPRSTDTMEYFRTVAELGVQAARALHCAHEHGVVHRDVKPSNLLLDFQGKLWITDFGLARIQTDATLTRTGDVVGTMRYMSPEQAAGQSVLVDHRTDVYALGMTLYELLTLCPAFSDEQGPALLRRIEHDDPPRPSRLNPEIPADIENVVLKAISKSRDDRYATADELADDLQRFLQGVPTAAKPPGVFERVNKWMRRHRKMVASAAGCGLSALCVLAVCALLVLQKNAERQAALAESQRNWQRAETNFRQAKQVVDQFGARLAERLAGVPAAEPIRRELLDETLRYYQGFIEQAADDPGLQQDIAITYSKIGGITERIGKNDESLLAYQQATAILERLSKRDPEDCAACAVLALCRSNLGLLLARTGKVDEGLRQIGQALAVQEQLVAEFPADASYAAAFALTQNNLGLLKSQVGEETQAEQSYLAAVKLQRRLLRDRTADARLRRNLAGSLNNLSMLTSRNKISAAVEYAEEALGIRQQLAESNPDNVEVLNELALALNNMGALHSRQDQNQRAAESYAEAIRLQSRLVELAPAAVAYRGDLAVSYNNLGLLQSQQARYPESLDAFRQALSLQQELAGRFPQDPDFISSLAGVYNNIGMVLRKQGEDAQAIEAFRLAVQHQEEACRRSPSVTRYREFLSKHRVNLERAQRDLGGGDEAPVDSARRGPARLSGL